MALKMDVLDTYQSIDEALADKLLAEEIEKNNKKVSESS